MVDLLCDGVAGALDHLHQDDDEHESGDHDLAPAYNPAAALVSGKVCGIDVAAVEDPTMHRVRVLDKLVDELAKGRPLEKILRQG